MRALHFGFVFSLAGVSTGAAASSFPRLAKSLPPISCGDSLNTRIAAAPDPNHDTSAVPIRVGDQADEIISLLRLSHPLLQRYLELRSGPKFDAEFSRSTELRLLILIYGDQPAFDLRSDEERDDYRRFERMPKRISGGEKTLADGDNRSFFAFEDSIRDWPFQTESARRKVVDELLDIFAEPTWNVKDTETQDTVYLDTYRVLRAFRDNNHALIWVSFSRHWDVDDAEGSSLRLHRRIAKLRQSLRANSSVREEVARRLTSDWSYSALPEVTRPAREFVRAVGEWAEDQPDRIKEEARRLARSLKPNRFRRYAPPAKFHKPPETPSKAPSEEPSNGLHPSYHPG